MDDNPRTAALELAIRYHADTCVSVETIVRTATAFYDFLRGKSDRPDKPLPRAQIVEMAKNLGVE